MINISGLTYWIISIAIVTTIVFVNHKIKFVTNSYWFWLVVGAVAFSWVLANRFIPDWVDYWQNHDYAYNNVELLEASKYISRAFMLDACPFFFSVLMISLIADPSRRIARIIAPIALVGAIISLGTIITSNNGENEDAIFSAQYIFLGLGRERCYFIMHWLQGVIAIGVLLNTPRSGWRVWIVSIASFLVYICYVEIVMGATKCCWFCTGLATNDYSPTGEYHIIDDALHFPRNLWFVYPMVLLPILGAMGVLVGGVAHDYLFTTKWIWKYGNKKSGDKFNYWDYDKFVSLNKSWW